MYVCDDCFQNRMSSAILVKCQLCSRATKNTRVMHYDALEQRGYAKHDVRIDSSYPLVLLCETCARKVLA